MADYRGAFVWYELSTTDPAAAKRFYRALMGWDVEEVPNMGGYAMFKAGAAQVGGVMAQQEQAKQMGAPPMWTCYVGVADVDATTAQAERLGARALVPPMDIPGIGRFSVIQDPQGAAIAMFQGSGEPMVAPSGIGGVSWHELATTDVDAALAFYGQIFGWVGHERMDMGEMGPYQMFGRKGERPLGGIYRRPPEMPVSNWLPYGRVPNIEQAATATREGGGTVLMGPMEVPGGDQVLSLRDPQGAFFAVHEVKG